MGAFRNGESSSVEINQENLKEFHRWVQTDRQPDWRSVNITISPDVPFEELATFFSNPEDGEKVIGRALYLTLHQDPSRIEEFFKVGEKLPRAFNFVVQSAGNEYGYRDSLYKKIGDALENRPMSDNLILLSDLNGNDFSGDWLGQPEDITSLPWNKSNALYRIMNDKNHYTKHNFVEKIFNRGDLLNYKGLSAEDREKAIVSYLRAHKSSEVYPNLVEKLDKKYFTPTIVKCIAPYYSRPGFGLTQSGDYSSSKEGGRLPDDYKKIRDIMIEMSSQKNSKSANAGFEDLCKELYGKSYEEIVSGLNGDVLLSDVYLRTAQKDVSEGKTQNLTPKALSLVLGRDKDGFYARKMKPRDIEVVNRYNKGLTPNVNPYSSDVFMNLDMILMPDGISRMKYDNKYSKLTKQERNAIIARSETRFKAQAAAFRMEMGLGWDETIRLSARYALLASDAVQQKKDFTPEQKAELKKLTGHEYSAQDILSLVDIKYEEAKEFHQQRLDTYRKVEAVQSHVNNDADNKTNASNTINMLQDAYKNIVQNSKNKNLDGKEEKDLQPERVEQLIQFALQGKDVRLDKPQYDTGFFASTFTSKKEKERREDLDIAINLFNKVLYYDIFRAQDTDELKQYVGAMLSPEALDKATKAKEQSQQKKKEINRLSSELRNNVVDYKKQQSIAEQIYAASPVPVEKLQQMTVPNDPDGYYSSTQLDGMEKGEQIFQETKEYYKEKIAQKKQYQEKDIKDEAMLQESQDSMFKSSKIASARKRLQAQSGNNMLLEEIDAGVKEKTAKRTADRQQNIDKLAIKAALKKKQNEK